MRNTEKNFPKNTWAPFIDYRKETVPIFTIVNHKECNFDRINNPIAWSISPNRKNIKCQWLDLAKGYVISELNIRLTDECETFKACIDRSRKLIGIYIGDKN